VIRICSGCGKRLGEKAPLDDRRISHGYCSLCEARAEATSAVVHLERGTEAARTAPRRERELL